MRLVAVALHTAALLVGAAVALASVVVHRVDVHDLPAGLLLALVTTFAVAWTLWQTEERRLATSYAAGWLLAFGAVLAGRPEGDFAVAGDPTGYLLTAAALAVVVIGISSLAGRRSGRRPPRRAGSVGGPA